MAKHYTREELKFVKDSSLSDKEVAERIGRTVQAVYCKRWSMTKRRPVKREKPMITVADTVVKKTARRVIERIVCDNVVIDITNNTLTITF